MPFKSYHLLVILLILILSLFRIYVGLQINFMHMDYIQIYLIGLENALLETWSFWGADVVWSETRLPGALQGLIGGLPLRLTGRSASPIIFSNLISIAGLLLMAYYAKHRFPKLSIFFLIALLLLAPFMFTNGVVLLNTAHLILTGALLFISVFELFIYRDTMLFSRNTCFFWIGFALLCTYQLHLTWIMFIPIILVLLILEYQHDRSKWWQTILFLFLGSLLGGLTVLPTLIKYWNVIFTNVEGNLVFEPGRLISIFDLAMRYFGMSTFDIIHKREAFHLAMEKHAINAYLIWIMKGLTIVQYIILLVALIRGPFSKPLRRTLILFGLTLLMALVLFVLGNKHLSVRTYILLYPVPIWLSLYAYEYFFRFNVLRYGVYSLLFLAGITFLSVGRSNQGDRYSLESFNYSIEEAIKHKDPVIFCERRTTRMDEYD